MRYGIISDIHSNLEALQSVLAALKNEGVRKIFCLGDTVGYGADPKECLSIVRASVEETVAGNHDWAACGNISADNFNSVARTALFWNRDQLSHNEMNHLKNLELIHKTDDMVLVHGTLNRPGEFGYMTDSRHALDTFFLMDRPVCFVGHTHVPQVFFKEESLTHILNLKTFEADPKKKYIVNIGSVGQPRDGDPRACYCIYDPDLRRVEIRRVEYNINEAQRKIIEAGLPDFLAQRLMIGQ